MSGEITRVGVVGLGVMGFDIAFLYAMKGCRTYVYDSSKAVMESLDSRREQTVERLSRRNRLSGEEIINLHGLLIPSMDLADLTQADLITEAVAENTETKRAVYQALRHAGFSGIVTTNTSSLPRATLLAGGNYERSRFALTHFFNPVLYTQMVEIVKGDMDEADSAAVLAFLERLGRHPIETRDISGFVSNGILMFYAVMALRLLERGAKIEQLDRAAKELELLPPCLSFDSWKPSIVEDVTQSMFELRGDLFLRSSRLLTALSKNNPKFYVRRNPNEQIYELAQATGQNLDDASVKRALLTSMLIAAARLAELGEAPETVDLIATEGIKMPRAPLKEIDSLRAVNLLCELAATNRLLSDQPLSAPRILTAMAEENQSFYKNDRSNRWLEDRVERLGRHASH